MPASYREIDYRIRPGKYAERLMMIEAFRRLRFGTVESYQYVGLGSVYFSDFSLVHKALGISKLVSIEKAEHDKKRFEANIPFGCIEMLWGETSTQLPNIDLGLRTIAWLDYDGRLSRSVLGDIREVAKRAVTGSVLAITVQSRFDRATHGDGTDGSVDAIKEALGEERVPFDLETKDLRGDGTGALYRNIILEEVSSTLAARNAGCHHAQQMQFRQILNFRYEDGARMMTVAFVFFDSGQQGIFNLCHFEQLDFFRSDEGIFDIAIPKLTPKEVRFLDSQMPNAIENVDLAALPPKDAAQYAKIYRYFPNVAFVDS